MSDISYRKLGFASIFFAVMMHGNVHAAEPDKTNQRFLFSVEGKTFTAKDLLPSEQNRVHELELNQYKMLEGIARQRYVEVKTAPFQSLNSKENSHAAEEKWLKQSFSPSSAEVDKALEAFKDEKQLQQLPVAERGRVMERYLAAQKRSKILTEVTDKALESGEIKMSVRKPEAPVFEISRSSQAVIGSSKNPIRVVEFTDFQCPYCKKLAPVSGEILKKYGSEIVWEVRHFPLSFHKQARAAAAAVHCAAQQGKLREAKAWIFDAQEKLEEEKIFQVFAKELALNVGEFERCKNNDATAKLIDADIKEGERIGVSGTPTLFVNGRRFQGDPQAIGAWDDMIKSARPKGAIHSL